MLPGTTNNKFMGRVGPSTSVHHVNILLCVCSGCKDVQDNVFSGKTLVDWLSTQQAGKHMAASRNEAVATANMLLYWNLITVVSDSRPSKQQLTVQDDSDLYYRLVSDTPRSIRWGQALNTHFWWGPKPARSAVAVAEDIRKQILALYDRYLSPDGRAVSYKAIRSDPVFWDYVNSTAELQEVGWLLLVIAVAVLSISYHAAAKYVPFCKYGLCSAGCMVVTVSFGCCGVHKLMAN